MICFERPGQLKTGTSRSRKTDIFKPHTLPSQPQAQKLTALLDRYEKFIPIGLENMVTPNKQLGGESLAARNAETRRRAMARRKAIDNETRAMRLRLRASKPKETTQNVISTDVHLEELYDDPAVSQTFGVQTEFDEQLFSNPTTWMSVSVDVSTQVNDIDLFDYEAELTKIAEVQVGDVFEKVIDEVVYEVEIELRDRKQRELCMQRTIEENRLQKLIYEDFKSNKLIAEHTEFFDSVKF